MKTIAFSCGDVNGIGPEIIIRTLDRIDKSHKIVLPVPEKIVQRAFEATGIVPKYSLTTTNKTFSPGLNVLDIPLDEFNPGIPTKSSGETAFNSIQMAYNLVEECKCDFLVTAPISKKALGLAGINFPGHTEMFQEWCNAEYPLMTFLSEELKCALVTIHEPLSKVSNLITREKLRYIFDHFYNSLKIDLGTSKPKIAVLGLNPHAGEDGRIGTEEKDLIEPVLEEYKELGFSGPYVPDAFFGNQSFKQFDAYIAMYHDQGLIPFKLMNFNQGVNYTAGLNIIRTSPDHGTAFDIAYKGIANEESFLEAVKWGIKIHDNRLKYGKDS